MRTVHYRYKQGQDSHGSVPKVGAFVTTVAFPPSVLRFAHCASSLSSTDSIGVVLQQRCCKAGFADHLRAKLHGIQEVDVAVSA